jgi:hypothetical protein
MNNELNDIGKIGAWRDPFIFHDPDSKKYYMLIAARKKGRSKEYNGCVAVAESIDLMKWKLLKPLLAPGIYDEMEVPQMILHGGFYYLFFSTHAANYNPRYSKIAGSHGGLHCYYSKKLFGKYQPVNENGVVFDREKEIYDLIIAANNKKTLTAIGWLNQDEKGKFIGKLSWPINFHINKDKIIPVGR